MRTYIVEFIQTDPPDSPTPGLAHFAGDRTCADRAGAIALATQSVGKPVPEEWFYPCCSWQRITTPVTGCHVSVMEAGQVVGAWEVRARGRT